MRRLRHLISDTSCKFDQQGKFSSNTLLLDTFIGVGLLDVVLHGWSWLWLWKVCWILECVNCLLVSIQVFQHQRSINETIGDWKGFGQNGATFAFSYSQGRWQIVALQGTLQWNLALYVNECHQVCRCSNFNFNLLNNVPFLAGKFQGCVAV